jgi:sugar/nucleoside kinase (ribokinase family)
VSTRYLKKIKNTETSCSIIINYKAEKTIMVYRGLKDYSKIIIPKSLRAKWFFVSGLGKGYEALFRQIISQAAEKNVNIAINPTNLQIKEEKYLKEILRITKVVFLNREEAADLCRVRASTQVKDMMQEIKKMGPQIVVITDGSEGAYCFDGDAMVQIGVYQAKRKEATGAGDAFSAGFLGALLASQDIKNALQYGVINSASVIEHIGAQEGLLTALELEKRLFKAPIPRQI